MTKNQKKELKAKTLNIVENTVQKEVAKAVEVATDKAVEKAMDAAHKEVAKAVEVATDKAVEKAIDAASPAIEKAVEKAVDQAAKIGEANATPAKPKGAPRYICPTRSIHGEFKEGQKVCVQEPDRVWTGGYTYVRRTEKFHFFKEDSTGRIYKATLIYVAPIGEMKRLNDIEQKAQAREAKTA